MTGTKQKGSMKSCKTDDTGGFQGAVGRTTWQCRGTEIDFNDGPVVMGILNVTPDSFSDGGRYPDIEAAVAGALEMAKAGARIIDIGGESSRPGAAPVSEALEIDRILPVIEKIAGKTSALLSVDTCKARVAERALDAGAHIINDISAFGADRDMPGVVARYGAGCVLMHMRGKPGTMQDNPVYEDVVEEVAGFLKAKIDYATGLGISLETIAVDPGIGFGKTAEHNVELLRNMAVFSETGRPVVAGVSRKSFLGSITGRDVKARMPASLAAAAYCVLNGADVLRAHDVAETVDVIKVLDTMRRKDGQCRNG